MNQSLSRQILEHLLICSPRLIIGAVFLPRNEGLNRALRRTEELLDACPHDFSSHSPETVSVTLHRMKKRKLVYFSGSKRKAIWQITNDGRKHFKEVKAGDIVSLPPEDGKKRLVVFDIPENRRRERNWLRGELFACDYGFLQKSVFMGTRPLPKKLLKELKRRELLSHVHVVGLEGDKR